MSDVDGSEGESTVGWYATRRSVIERDGSECRECGEPVGPDDDPETRLCHVHHIDGDRENNDPENLVTLCAECHGEKHETHGVGWPRTDVDEVVDALSPGERATTAVIRERVGCSHGTVLRRLKEATARGDVTRWANTETQEDGSTVLKGCLRWSLASAPVETDIHTTWDNRENTIDQAVDAIEPGERVSAQTVADRMGCSYTTARNRLDEAIEDGRVTERRETSGMATLKIEYMLSDDTEPDEMSDVDGSTEPENTPDDSEQRGPVTKTETVEREVCPECGREMMSHHRIESDERLAQIEFPSKRSGISVCVDAGEPGEPTWLFVHPAETYRVETEREVARYLKRVIRSLASARADAPGAPKEMVIDNARDRGMSRDETEYELERLRDKGEVYEPDKDHLALV